MRIGYSAYLLVRQKLSIRTYVNDVISSEGLKVKKHKTSQKQNSDII